MRPLLHVLGGIQALALVGGVAWSLLGVALRDTYTERTKVYSGVRELVVDAEAGNVVLRAAAGAAVRVDQEVTRGLWEPARRSRRPADGLLRLSSTCPALNNGHCGVDYRIAVPAGTTVTVRARGGDVIARGLRADRRVVLRTSGGMVDARGVAAPAVELSATAGSVTATGVAARAITATSSAGPVDVTTVEPPRLLRISSSAGPVSARVPDAAYDVEASSSAGEVRDEGLRRDPASPNRLQARSSAGDVVLGPVR